MKKVAVIGAGLAGLVVARSLKGRADVVVIEKSRGAGGRMATRKAGPLEFDHGAQFFTARTAAFQQFLQPLSQRGVIDNWTATFAEIDPTGILSLRSWGDEVPHYVGTPNMRQIGSHLAEGLNIAFDSQVTSLTREGERWRLSGDDGEDFGLFDWVVLTAPAAQTAGLADASPTLAALCADREMKACFALMLGFDKPLNLPWQAALVRNADISWISVNSSKPGRASPFTLVVHSTNAWADAHIDDEPESVRSHMVDEAARVLSEDVGTATHCDHHRWRYANIDKQPGPAFFFDAAKGLAACGDWFVRGRIEAAFTSASGLASAMASHV